MDFAIIPLIFQVLVLIFSVVIHEVSHGFLAYRLGDPTAKYEGRLTLNPFKHLDLFGSIIIPITLAILRLPIIGAAKPVPYNPNYFRIRNRELGAAIVGAAGPLSNILLAVLFGILFRIFFSTGLTSSGDFLSIFAVIIVINIQLAIFNLLPIPPLDGSKILFWLLPIQFDDARLALERYGLLILLFLVFFGSRFGLLDWLGSLTFWLFYLVTGLPFGS